MGAIRYAIRYFLFLFLLPSWSSSSTVICISSSSFFDASKTVFHSRIRFSLTFNIYLQVKCDQMRSQLCRVSYVIYLLLWIWTKFKERRCAWIFVNFEHTQSVIRTENEWEEKKKELYGWNDYYWRCNKCGMTITILVLIVWMDPNDGQQPQLIDAHTHISCHMNELFIFQQACIHIQFEGRYATIYL